MNDQTTPARSAQANRPASAGRMIQRLAAGLDAAMKAGLAVEGLTLDQFVVLMTLAEGDGVTQTELGSRVRLANYTVTRALDALCARGLTERRPDAASRRAHRVVLTAAGQALMPALLEIVAAQNARLLSPLDDADRAAFLAILARLVAGDPQVKSAR